MKKRADGRYVCKYKGKCFYGRSPDEAKQARKDYIKQEAAGLLLQQELTVKAYALKWLPLHKSGVGEKTYNDYAKQLEALFPYIGNKLLSQVTVDDAASVWQHYAGYSQSTIDRSRSLFIAMFDTAIENDLCRKNPFKSRYSKPPAGTVGSHRAIEQWERDIILSFPHRMQAPAMLMLYAGLRRGEMLALTDKDIAYEVNKKTKKKIPVSISVSQAVRFDSNVAILSDPKTDAGIRTVPVFEPLRPYLQDLNGYILKNNIGKICSETSFRNAWKSWKNKIELMLNNCRQKRWYYLSPDYRLRDPERYDQIQLLLRKGKKKEAEDLRFKDWKTWTVRPHDLRHSFCTMLRDAGVDMKQAMLWMGHADEKMILRIYDHTNDYRTSVSIQKVETMLSSRKSVPLRAVR